MSLSAKMREELRRRIECVYQAKVITWESKDRLIGKLADWEDWQEDRLRRWEALIPVVKSEPTHCLCPQCGEVAEIRVGKFGPFWGCPNHRKTGCRGSIAVSKESSALYVDPLGEVDKYHVTSDQLRTLQDRWVPEYHQLCDAAHSEGYAYDDAALDQAVAAAISGEITEEQARKLMSGVEEFSNAIMAWVDEAAKRAHDKIINGRKRTARFAGLVRGRK